MNSEKMQWECCTNQFFITNLIIGELKNNLIFIWLIYKILQICLEWSWATKKSSSLTITFGAKKKTKNSVLRVFPESYQYAVTYSKYSGFFFFCYYLGYRHAKPVFIYDSIAWQTQTAGTKDKLRKREPAFRIELTTDIELHPANESSRRRRLIQ